MHFLKILPMPSLRVTSWAYSVLAKVVPFNVPTNFVVGEKIVLRLCAAWFTVENWTTEKKFHQFNYLQMLTHIIVAIDKGHLFYIDHKKWHALGEAWYAHKLMQACKNAVHSY